MPRVLRWMPWAFAGLGILLRASVLRAGFVSDDYVLLAGLEGRPPRAIANRAFDLWSFYDGNPARQAKLVFEGALPWWTAPDASHAFLRPLSSALLVGVHALFGRLSAGYYAVVLAVGAATVVLAGRVFERLLPPPATAAALLFFSFHALHVDPTRWISAVHIPLATAAGLAGWWLHLRWRAAGGRLARIASVVAFGLGLLAGETGLCVLALFVGHELLASPTRRSAVGPSTTLEVGAGSRPRGRLAAVVPAASLGAAYVVLYLAFHRGAHAIGGYLDARAPLPRVAATLAARAVRQLPRLVTAAAESAPSEWGAGLEGVVGLALAGIVAMLTISAARFDRAALKGALAWVAAAVLAALPALLGPTDRALYPATLGSSAALGALVGSAWTLGRSQTLTPRGLRTAALLGAALLTLVELAGGVAANAEGAAAMAAISARQLGAVSALTLDDPEATDVVVLAADSQTTGPWGGLLYAFATGHAPASWQALSIEPGPLSVGRLADDTIELALAGESPFRMGVYRDEESQPMQAGDRVVTRGLAVEVVQVRGGRPTRVRVKAERSLDDPGFCFAARAPEKLTRVRLPPPGLGMWLR